MKGTFKKKYWIIAGVILVLIITYFIGIEQIEQTIYDANHQNNYVSNSKQLNQILKQFPKIHISKIPKSILQSAYLNKSPYAAMTQNQRFFIIHKKDVYRKIVGNYRIKDLYSNEPTIFDRTIRREKKLLNLGL